MPLDLPPIPPAITALAEDYDLTGSYQPTAADYAELAESFALADASRYCPALRRLMVRLRDVANHPAFVAAWGTELADLSAPLEPWFPSDGDAEELSMDPEPADLPF